MPREINVQVEMEMDMMQITKDIVDTLERNQNSRQVQKLAQIVGNKTVEQGQLLTNISGNKQENLDRRVRTLESENRRRG